MKQKSPEDQPDLKEIQRQKPEPEQKAAEMPQ